MVWVKILGWLSIIAFAAWVVGLLSYRCGELYGRSGVGWWSRVAKSDLMRCRVCGGEHAIKAHDGGSDTCGHPGCVRFIMDGRARMADARRAAGFSLGPKMVPAVRDDGTSMFMSTGEPVMVRDSSGEWERRPGPGGSAAQQAIDAEALEWRRRAHEGEE